MSKSKKKIINTKVNMFIAGAMSVAILASGVAVTGYASNKESRDDKPTHSHTREHSRNLSPQERESKKDKFMEGREDKIEKKEIFKKALEDGDFESFKKLTQENAKTSKILENIKTEEDFKKLQEASKLRSHSKEDRQKAREIMKELGFEEKEHFHKKNMRIKEGVGK